jgi:hypothetical protein
MIEDGADVGRPAAVEAEEREDANLACHPQQLLGRPIWLHAWVGDQATCYVIDPHRSADALEKVIDLDYSGTLVHDGAASYDRFLEASHQGCVAHPLRRAHNLEETQIGRARAFPRQVIDLFQEALAVRDAVAAGTRILADPCATYEDYCDRLRRLTERPRANEANDTFAQHLYNYGHTWFQPFPRGAWEREGSHALQLSALLNRPRKARLSPVLMRPSPVKSKADL